MFETHLVSPRARTQTGTLSTMAKWEIGCGQHQKQPFAIKETLFAGTYGKRLEK
jgi:hypothetical protein